LEGNNADPNKSATARGGNDLGNNGNHDDSGTTMTKEAEAPAKIAKGGDEVQSQWHVVRAGDAGAW